MTDLTKIDTPFGLLDKATQDALRCAEGEFEIYTTGGWACLNWKPTWSSTVAYRQKPEPVRVVRCLAHYIPTKRAALGRHRITCREDGTDPTVTWEPSE